MDQGNTWSETDILRINVTDDSIPQPVITVNNVVISDNISILTNQMIQFSASRTLIMSDSKPRFPVGLGRWDF